MLAEGLLLLGALYPAGVCEQVVERAELAEEGAGEALADTGHARDVIDGVAGQGQEIDDLVGADSPFLLEPRGVHDLVLAEVEMRICSLINWRASLSAVTMKTSRPRSWPRRARVAITSSASIMGSMKTGTRKPSNRRRMTGIWGTRSSGISLRVALYSAKMSERNTGPGPSNATAR